MTAARCIGIAAAIVAILVSVVAWAADDQAELDGRPIVRIVFERYNVFDTSDPATSAWFYRAANAVRIRSREGLIRSALLFTEGDPYSAGAAAESARLLRKLGFINPVEITAHPVDGGVEVVVETHDQWSLQLGGDAGVTGERSSYGFQIQEENFLGWGKTVTLEYASDEERDTRVVRYQDPHILGSRWTADLIYEDRSDGEFQRVKIERPFYSLQTTNGWGGWWESEDTVEHLWADGASTVSGRRDSRFLRGWYGIQLPSPTGITRRLVLGWEVNEAIYGDWRFEDTGRPYTQPADRDISGIRLSYERVTDNFEVLRGFRAWSSQEDVALGPNAAFGLTFSAPAFGGDVNRVLFDSTLSIGRYRNRWLLLADGNISGRFDEGAPRNIVAGLRLTAVQIGYRGFQLHLLVEGSHELDRDRQLTLGADVGLRGWDPATFDGTNRALANAQWRTILFRDVLKLFSVGAVVFADAGATWDARVGRDTDGIRADAGVGLLFDLSRFSTDNILRVEIAWPDDGSGPVINLTGSSLF